MIECVAANSQWGTLSVECEEGNVVLTAQETINVYEAIRLFHEIMDTDTQKRILALTGVGKIGKSHLLTNIFPVLAREEYQARYALLDLSTPFSSVQDMLSQLCIQLGEQDFPAYDLAMQGYISQSRSDDASTPTTPLAQIAVVDKDYQGTAYCKARYLTTQFIKDSSQPNDQPILLLFDNVEEASPEIQWWLMKILLHSVSHLKHMHVVLAGRSLPEPAKSYQELYLYYQLQPITHVGEYVVYCQNNQISLSEQIIYALVPEIDYVPGLFIDALPRFTVQPDAALIEEFAAVKDSAEKAGRIAEAYLSILPDGVAHIARSCVLFHWFDETLIEALQGSALNIALDAPQLYEQLRVLPFVEVLPWGLRFQRLTRAGLLQHYERTQPELLKQAAERGAAAYESRRGAKKIATELLFCAIVAGDHKASLPLLHKLQEEAYAHSDWHYLKDLLALQEEAERFSFVRPLPKDEDYWLLRGLVSHLEGRQEQAISSYSKAIKLNKKNALTYVQRGSAYAEQQRFRKALANYKRALSIAPNMAVIYASRGSLSMQKGDHVSTLKDLDEAIKHSPDDPALYYRKGVVLHKSGDNDKALAAFDEVIRLDPYYAAAHRDKGTILNTQEKYQEALTECDAALDLDPYHAGTYREKGKALTALKMPEESSLAYNEAASLAADTTVESDSLARPDLISVSPQKGGKQQRKKRGCLPPFFVSKRERGKKRKDDHDLTIWEKTGPGTLLATFIVAVLLLLGYPLFTSMTVFHSLLSSYDGTATAVAISERANATALAAYNPTATAIANPDTYGSFGGTFVFYDPLTYEENWSETSNVSFGSACQFKKDGYHVTKTNGKGTFNCLDSESTFDNMVFEVKMKLKGDCGGLDWRYSPSTGTGYMVFICSNNSYQLVKYSGFSTTDEAILDSGKIGLNVQQNTLAVAAESHTFTLYVNHNLIDSVTDSDYSIGEIGLLAQEQTRLTEAIYTDARLWQL